MPTKAAILLAFLAIHGLTSCANRCVCFLDCPEALCSTPDRRY